MKEYFFYAWKGLQHHKLRNILFTLQLALCFIVVNFLIGGINNQSMRLLPYKDILKKGGFYCWTYRDMDFSAPEKYEVSNICNQLEGKVTCYEMWNTSFQYEGNQVIGLICEDVIFEQLILPLRTGTKPAAVGEVYASPNHIKLKAGSTPELQLYDNTMISCKITGVLTNPCYIPTFSRYEDGKGVEMLYRAYEENTADVPYIMMSKSTAESLGIFTSAAEQAGLLMNYEKPVSLAAHQRNTHLLATLGIVIPSDEILETSQNRIDISYRKFIPLAFIIFIVALVGFIFHIALQSVTQLPNYAVYTLCGLPCYGIIIVNMLIVALMMTAAVLLCFLFCCLSLQLSITSRLGLLFQSNNVTITMMMCAVCFVMSIIAPVWSMIRKTPLTMLKRRQE